jgi:hypothetical protein
MPPTVPNPAVALVEQLTARLLATLPTSEEVRGIYRQAALEVAKAESDWLPAPAAAKHCGWSLRSFRRKRDELGIPYCEIDQLQRYYRADLDAVLAAHVVSQPGGQVIEFPSLALRDEAAAKASHAA